MTDSPAAPPLTGRDLLRIPNFLLLVFGRAAVTLALLMQIIAIGWQVYAITGDPLALGLVGLAGFIPGILFALVTGQVADRVNRRTIIACCYGLETLTAAFLLAATLDGLTSVWPIFLAAFALGTARAFAQPASQALMPNLVPSSVFSVAVAWSSSVFQVAVIAGPAVGGLLFAWHQASAVYLASATLLAIGFVMTLFMRLPAAPIKAKEPVTWRTLVAGFSFMKAQPIVLGAISLDLFAVLFGGATALLPIFASDILKVGPEGLGALRSAPAVGAAIAAVVLGFRPLKEKVGRTLFIAVAIFGVATVVFGVSTNLWISLLALAALGAADEVSVVVRLTLVQIATPDEMRGRVAAVNTIFIGASNELGEFESGVAAHFLGPEGAVVFGGICTLLVTLLWMRWFPALRRVNTFQDKLS